VEKPKLVLTFLENGVTEVLVFSSEGLGLEFCNSRWKQYCNHEIQAK